MNKLKHENMGYKKTITDGNIVLHCLESQKLPQCQHVLMRILLFIVYIGNVFSLASIQS